MSESQNMTKFVNRALLKFALPNAAQQLERLIYGRSTCVIEGIEPSDHNSAKDKLHKALEETGYYEQGFNLRIVTRTKKRGQKVHVLVFKPRPLFDKRQIG